MMEILNNKIGNFLPKLEENLKHGKTGLKTYFNNIDRKIGALPGLVSLVGDPKAGKSTWIMNVVLNNAMHGVPVLLCDQENGLERTQIRMLCALGDLEKYKIEKQKFSPEEKSRYEEAKRVLAKLPIYYIARLDFEELEPMIEQIGKAHQRHIFVVLDSLNRLVKNFDQRRNEVDMWLNHFNMLKEKYAGYLTILFVAEKGQQDIGMANTQRAKESSAIPYIAEMTLNIYRKEGEQHSKISSVFNRDGATGLLTKLVGTDPYTYRILDEQFLPGDEE